MARADAQGGSIDVRWIPDRRRLPTPEEQERYSLLRVVPYVNLPVPVLHPMLLGHAATLTGMPRDQLELVLVGDARIPIDQVPGTPSIELIDDNTVWENEADWVELTGSQAIARLLERVDLDQQLARLDDLYFEADDESKPDALRAYQLVARFIDEGRSPLGILLPEIEAPHELMVMGEPVPQSLLGCSEDYAAIEDRVVRYTNLTRIHAPAIIMANEHLLLYAQIVSLFVRAGNAVARSCGIACVDSDLRNQSWVAQLRFTERCLQDAVEAVDPDEIEARDLSPRMTALTWFGRVAALRFRRVQTP